MLLDGHWPQLNGHVRATDLSYRNMLAGSVAPMDMELCRVLISQGRITFMMLELHFPTMQRLHVAVAQHPRSTLKYFQMSKFYARL